jgi:glycerol-3-phosphate acyltransferase PlsY
LLLTRWTGKGDIREIGSGNIGATNVLRTGSKGLAAATLILDAVNFAAAGALIGHLYPLWLGFKGGKGVATMLGILAPLIWQAALVYAVLWVGLLLVVRISSVAGMTAAASAPVTAAVLGEQQLFPMLLGFALLVIYKHRENIRRLAKGEEPRLGRQA